MYSKMLSHAAQKQAGSRSWYSLLGFVQCVCLLPKLTVCLLVTKVPVKLHKWMWGLLNSCHQMSPCLSTNFLLKTGSYIQTQSIKFPTWKCISYIHLDSTEVMVLLVGIHPMCLLVTKVSVKSLQCARMCLLVSKVFLKASKWEATWMLVTKVSP